MFLNAGQSWQTFRRSGWQWQPLTYEGDDLLTGISHADANPPITIDTAAAVPEEHVPWNRTSAFGRDRAGRNRNHYRPTRVVYA